MKEKIITVVKWTCVLAFFPTVWYVEYSKESRLREYGLIAKTQLTGYHRYNYGYKFTTNKNEIVKGGQRLGIVYDEIFIGKFFLIIYNPSDPSDNEILVTKKDFSTYNLVYPDSLKWVEKYLK